VVVGSLELEPITDAVGVLGPFTELYPEVPPVESDRDHGRAAETRRALVEEVADTNTLVVCGHYPGSGIGRVSRDDGRVLRGKNATPTQGGAERPASLGG
jgi:hypothetical protein